MMHKTEIISNLLEMIRSDVVLYSLETSASNDVTLLFWKTILHTSVILIKDINHMIFFSKMYLYIYFHTASFLKNHHPYKCSMFVAKGYSIMEPIKNMQLPLQNKIFLIV